MKTVRTANQVREGVNFKKFNDANGKTAVIATIPISKRKQDLGIQFWNKKDIENKCVTNLDGTISNLFELY